MAVRQPLLERVTLSEEFFAPLTAAAVYDPDPGFCEPVWQLLLVLPVLG